MFFRETEGLTEFPSLTGEQNILSGVMLRSGKRLKGLGDALIFFSRSTNIDFYFFLNKSLFGF